MNLPPHLPIKRLMIVYSMSYLLDACQRGQLNGELRWGESYGFWRHIWRVKVFQVTRGVIEQKKAKNKKWKLYLPRAIS